MKDFLPKLASDYFLFSAVFVLAIIVFLLAFWDIKLAFYNQTLFVRPYDSAKVNDYPLQERVDFSGVTASSLAILDKDSGVFTYSKNGSFSFPSASTTKIMTAIVALETFSPEDVITVKEDFPDGVTIGLSKGESIKFKNIIYALMLPSANDAAAAIADNYLGGKQAFVARMNDKAHELGLSGTHYEDPHGLSAGNYSTAQDLGRLASYALEKKTFREVVSTKYKNISNESGKTYSLTNLNKLLGETGIVGVKTGYTEEAGQVLVVSKEEPIDGKNRTTIIVVMKSNDRFEDMKKVLGGISGRVTYLSIYP